MTAGGAGLVLAGGIMQFTPAAPAGWIIGGTGVVVGVSGAFVYAAGDITEQAGAEGY